MDNFAEQLVKKEISDSERIKNIVILILGLCLSAALILLALMIGHLLLTFVILIAAAAVAGGIILRHRNTKIEYEYTFTNGELDIDKIIAQAKRKEMLSIQVSKFAEFGKYDENTPEETEDMTVVIVSDNILSHEYYADFSHEDYGKTRLVFSPDERMLSSITDSLHPSIRNKAKNELKKRFVSELSSE